MSRESAPRSSSVLARGLALTGSALVGLAMFCWQLAAMTRSAWRSVLAPGPADPAQSLAALAGALALVLIVWLFGALAVSLLAALGPKSSAVGRAAARGAGLIAPLILRNAVAAVLGVAIAASPAVADAAQPGPSSGPGQAHPTTRSVPAGAVAQLSPSWMPRAEQAPDLLPDLLPGWLPGRPSSPAHSSGSVSDLSAAPPRRRAKVNPDDQVVVRRGDTLWDIAARHLGAGATDAEIAMEWPHWFTANRSAIGTDPDHLVAGERLRPPDAGPARQRLGDLRAAKDGTAR